MKIKFGLLKEIIAEGDETEKYLQALDAQRAAEERNDLMTAKDMAHKAAAIFFVMDPRDQAAAAKIARTRGLA